jgi:cytochrome bd-type quinol oxidase subunit 2
VADEGPSIGPARRPRTNEGFGRVLVVVYAIFALAATARSLVQIATRFDEAPIAYALSALAALVYIVATVALARGDRTSHRVATAAITVELVGVLLVGAISALMPTEFPKASVWSGFGSGYGFIPLVLPLVGLWWLRRTRSGPGAD